LPESWEYILLAFFPHFFSIVFYSISLAPRFSFIASLRVILMSMDETSERILRLEEQFLFQERTIDQLNSVIIEQQAQLNVLENRIKTMEKRLALLLEYPSTPTSFSPSS